MRIAMTFAVLATLVACGSSPDTGTPDSGGDSAQLTVEDTAQPGVGDTTGRSVSDAQSVPPSVAKPTRRSTRLLPTIPKLIVPILPTRSATRPETTPEVTATAPSVPLVPAAEPQSACVIYEGEGCYWMENTSGNYCWVPWPNTDIHLCKRRDSCDGGDGWSGGGCYKWAGASSGTRAAWPTHPPIRARAPRSEEAQGTFETEEGIEGDEASETEDWEEPGC